MRMTPWLFIIGSLMVFWASVGVLVFLPILLVDPPPSEIWRPFSEEEAAGLRVYAQNGCAYCHTQFVRTMDWGLGAERIAQAGDYVNRGPILLGTERNGPDLSQEGGEHPNDWHLAHFTNPRYTSPYSIMPSWEFLGKEDIEKLTKYMQAEGMLAADYRVDRQGHWKKIAVEAFNRGYDSNVEWLHSMVPKVWREMPNPYPPLPANLARGQKIYQQFCIGCHGPIGDGDGPASPYLDPKPFNFTSLKRNLVENKYIGGLLYYQIMNGITGTAMPYFKNALESGKIWDVSNYVAVNFIGYSDATMEPRGIEAAFEPEWKNPYTPPNKEGFSDQGFRSK